LELAPAVAPVPEIAVAPCGEAAAAAEAASAGAAGSPRLPGAAEAGSAALPGVGGAAGLLGKELTPWACGAGGAESTGWFTADGDAGDAAVGVTIALELAGFLSLDCADATPAKLITRAKMAAVLIV